MKKKKRIKVVDTTKLSREEFDKFLKKQERKRKNKILAMCGLIYFSIFSIILTIYINFEKIQLNKEGIVQLITLAYVSALGFFIFPKNKK